MLSSFTYDSKYKVVNAITILILCLLQKLLCIGISQQFQALCTFHC